jgi:uncharacterized protein (DUF736 family)
MIIGKFTYQVTKYVGIIKIIGFESDCTFLQVTNKHSESAPDFRAVDRNGMEFGAAWINVSEKGNKYLSVKFDSPMLAAPFNCVLLETDHGFHLKWERPKPREQSQPTSTNSRWRAA